MTESFVWHPVKNITTKDDLAWIKDSCGDNVYLDESKTTITVRERGVYLAYVQLTYKLRKTALQSDLNLNLRLLVKFNYDEATDDFSAAFDTRQLTEKDTDSHLSAFILLKMNPNNSFSVSAEPKERIRYDDIRPFSSYITIIQYADW